MGNQKFVQHSFLVQSCPDLFKNPPCLWLFWDSTKMENFCHFSVFSINGSSLSRTATDAEDIIVNAFCTGVNDWDTDARREHLQSPITRSGPEITSIQQSRDHNVLSDPSCFLLLSSSDDVRKNIFNYPNALPGNYFNLVPVLNRTPQEVSTALLTEDYTWHVW